MFPVSPAGEQTHKSLQLPKTIGPYNISLTNFCISPLNFHIWVEDTVMFLEHSDKDSNFANQCTLCWPLMANGVNNYRSRLR